MSLLLPSTCSAFVSRGCFWHAATRILLFSAFVSWRKAFMELINYGRIQDTCNHDLTSFDKQWLLRSATLTWLGSTWLGLYFSHLLRWLWGLVGGGGKMEPRGQPHGSWRVGVFLGWFGHEPYGENFEKFYQRIDIFGYFERFFPMNIHKKCMRFSAGIVRKINSGLFALLLFLA